MTQHPVRLGDLIDEVLAKSPEGDALQHLADAVDSSQRLGELADHLIGHIVDHARRSGASWTDIGAHMGVTKQAAQKRFVPRESEDLDFPAGGRLSRFTPRARNSVQVAKAEAQRLNHDRVTNAHLLLGLLGEPEGLAAKALVALGAPAERLREAALAALPPGRTAPKHLRFGRGAKKTLELSLREALRLNHNYIGTEHILLGLLRNDDDVTSDLLQGFGITRDGAHDWLVQELATIAAAKRG
jgi:hypothetical protein